MSFSVRAEDITLSQTLTAAHQNNPAITSARETARSQQLTAYSRWGNALPTLSAEGYWGGTRYEANGQSDFIHPRGTGLTLTQPIFTGGEIVYAARAASANARAAEADAGNITQQTLLTTVQTYTGTLAAQARVSATESLVASLSRQTSAAEARLKAGEGTTTDVALTTARRQEAEGSLALAKANLATLWLELSRLSTVSLTENSTLVWPQPIPGTLSATIQPTVHPAYQAALGRARAAEATQKSVRGALLPDLNATATASQNEDTSTARTSGSQMAYQLRLSVPLFYGFSKVNDTRAAGANARAAGNNLADTRSQIEVAQATAAANLSAAEANYKAAQGALTAQQKYYNSIDKTFAYGESSLLDLLDAAQARANAEANLADARANHINQSYNALAAFGQLSAPPAAAPISPTNLP